MSQVYTAQSVTGVVFVVSASGQTRTLKVGDRVLKGETLVTGARGKVVLVADDAPPLQLDGDRQLKIDDSLFASTAPTPASAAVASGTIDRVIDTLAGTGDLTEELEAPAAGAGAGAGGDGSSFVRLLRVSEGVDPLAFSFSTDLSDVDGVIDPNAVPLDDIPSVAVTVDPRDPPLLVPNEAVFESALPQGNGGGTRQASGQLLVDGGGNGLASLVVGGVDVTAGGQVPGAHGLLVVTLAPDGTYTWVYTLNEPTTDAPGQDETDDFTVVVTDADGDTATATLTVLIIDDQPIALPDEGSVAEGATLVVPAETGVLVNDSAGADGWTANGAAVVGVVPGNDTTRHSTSGAGTAVAGAYGTLTLNPDGSYTYVANADSTSVNAQEVFVYTVLDSDGDLISTTLTINIGNVEPPAPPPPPPARARRRGGGPAPPPPTATATATATATCGPGGGHGLRVRPAPGQRSRQPVRNRHRHGDPACRVDRGSRVGHHPLGQLHHQRRWQLHLHAHDAHRRRAGRR
jgi:VCBS repeat-containing protein